ncbi:cation-translocating P-type ATPase [Mumia quercus]|uniref:cation-translocating P-type ATPase n=1 Tax=Mumia quercus TaxID=2976125 RepID=UPI0021D237C1|nr:cation-translocating P-type ATPase [Mumia quercus]
MAADAVKAPDAAGLTSAEVAERRAAGLANEAPRGTGRSVPEIIRANVLTRINAILLVLWLVVMSTGYVVDGLFGLMIIANSGIGIVQELRAKRTLDRLSILGTAKPRVRRDGQVVEVEQHEVVRDDVIELARGDQLIVDGTLVDAHDLEIDESLLTGESDPVTKVPGDAVLSGSFVVAGRGAMVATGVGGQAHAAQLTQEASRFTLVSSELRDGINRILKVITFLMVPVALLTILNQLLRSNEGWQDSVRRMVAALVPMVPEGLVLLTSVAFFVGVVRLGQRQCLVQELPAIEGLARVDVVCTDKTGTLTENGMRLSTVTPVEGVDPAWVDRALAAVASAEPDPNASAAAIAEGLPAPPPWRTNAVEPFSSARKWSGASYEETDGGPLHLVLGASDVLLPPGSPVRSDAERIGAGGLRVLLLGSSARSVDADDAPGAVTPLALVVLEQRVRPDARATLEYFADQGVDVKVISGDNAVSVGAVAEAVGLAPGSRPLDARDLPAGEPALGDVVEATSAFGRVTPDQKRTMVHALQERGRTVAMTGDGVNDVLALKDADIGVAMGSGSPAARGVAQLVLLDDAFATLPSVVAEGRRVIGNIERVATLFLAKTCYSLVLATVVAVAGLSYPLLPRHLTIVGWFTIGVPAFVLSLAPNNARARPGFVRRVLRLAVPSGLLIGLCAFATYLLVRDPSPTEAQLEQSGTAVLVTMICLALWLLAIVARPLVAWKIALLVSMAALYVVLFAVPFSRGFFALDLSHPWQIVTGLVVAAAGIVLLELAWSVEAKFTQDDEHPRRALADPGPSAPAHKVA